MVRFQLRKKISDSAVENIDGDSNRKDGVDEMDSGEFHDDGTN